MQMSHMYTQMNRNSENIMHYENAHIYWEFYHKQKKKKK